MVEVWPSLSLPCLSFFWRRPYRIVLTDYAHVRVTQVDDQTESLVMVCPLWSEWKKGILIWYFNYFFPLILQGPLRTALSLTLFFLYWLSFYYVFATNNRAGTTGRCCGSRNRRSKRWDKTCLGSGYVLTQWMLLQALKTLSMNNKDFSIFRFSGFSDRSQRSRSRLA